MAPSSNWGLEQVRRQHRSRGGQAERRRQQSPCSSPSGGRGCAPHRHLPCPLAHKRGKRPVQSLDLAAIPSGAATPSGQVSDTIDRPCASAQTRNQAIVWAACTILRRELSFLPEEVRRLGLQADCGAGCGHGCTSLQQPFPRLDRLVQEGRRIGALQGLDEASSG